MLEPIPLSVSLLVLLAVYVPLQLAVWVSVLRDVWRERWNGKFNAGKHDVATEDLPPHTYAESDIQAFVETLYDDTVTGIEWRMTVAVPLLVAGSVTAVWLLLTEIALVVTGWSL